HTSTHAQKQYTCVCTLAQTRARTHTHTHTHTHTRAHTCTHVHTRAHTRAHTHTQSKRSLSETHTHTLHSLSYTHCFSLSHSLTLMFFLLQTHLLSHTHTHWASDIEKQVKYLTSLTCCAIPQQYLSTCLHSTVEGCSIAVIAC